MTTPQEFLQVYANSPKGKTKTTVQMIEFCADMDEALDVIAELEEVNTGHRPYVYTVACELPAVRKARELSNQSWATVSEYDIFGDYRLDNDPTTCN